MLYFEFIRTETVEIFIDRAVDYLYLCFCVSRFRVFFMEKYGFTAEDANFINSLLYFISAGASPLFGYVIDKTGRNVSWMLLSVLVTIGSHSFLAFTSVNPYYCMV